jgi:hypothetical protein
VYGVFITDGNRPHGAELIATYETVEEAAQYAQEVCELEMAADEELGLDASMGWHYDVRNVSDRTWFMVYRDDKPIGAFARFDQATQYVDDYCSCWNVQFGGEHAYHVRAYGRDEIVGVLAENSKRFAGHH